MEDDPRFSKALKDPKFRRMPKYETKVKIDKRFESMFNDKKFSLKYTVDKRGRPINNTSTEDLKRYYALSSDGSASEEQEEQEEEEEKTEDKKYVNKISVNKNDKIIPDHIKKKLKNLKVDYARGEGCLYTDSSSDDDEESEVEDPDEGLDHAWGELDRDAERTDEITNRLAACNMDWDRIKAVDLLMILSSFLPTGGSISSVTIYPSEFGLKRLQEEEIKGPIELVEADPREDDDNEGSKFHMEKLRQYQLKRLQYYYAVIICDSKETANKIYEECDGVEYESSSTKLDLRFIEDGETFDQEPKDVCDKLPEPGKYKPKYFTTTALQQAKVDLTWDETDPDRVELADRLAKNKEVDDLDLKAYLATSSEEEEEDEVENENSVEDDVQSKVSVIDKYKALLLDIEEENDSKKPDVIMEMSWGGLGSKEKTEKLVKKKLEEKVEKTPFEQYLDKRKEKRKLKREENKKKASKVNEDDDDDDDESDDIPSDVDMNDPYFAEEFDKGEFKQKKKKQKSKKEDKVDSEDEKAQAELELLLSNDDGKNHFSLQKIQERESGAKSKKKNKKKVQKTNIEDDFEIDVADDRFSALYTSHHFNIDPTDAHYKKTKGIDAIINEKLKRRKESDDISSKINKNDNSGKSAEMNVLVKSLKRKTEAFGYNKTKKMKRNNK